MKAITLDSVWAWCVAHAGKDIENRLWIPKSLKLGETLCIHSSLKFDESAAVWLAAGGVIKPSVMVPQVVPQGCITCVATYGGIVAPGSSQWCNGHMYESSEKPVRHIKLENVIVLPREVRATGKLGIWELSIVEEQEVREGLERAKWRHLASKS